jgi:dephospho-CoA kinase
MFTIGLIGGIASGKSEVARLLGERGAVVIDADRVAHEAYARGSAGFDAVVAAFGPDVAASDGTIDRRQLGAKVFGDTAALKRLTDIVWPITRGLLEERKRAQDAQGTRVLVIEAAILVEAGWQDLVDEIWFVRTSRETALQRLQERRGLSLADAEARIAARDLTAPLAAATRIIDNDGDLAELEQRVDTAWREVVTRKPESAAQG